VFGQGIKLKHSLPLCTHESNYHHNVPELYALLSHLATVA